MDHINIMRTDDYSKCVRQCGASLLFILISTVMSVGLGFGLSNSFYAGLYNMTTGTPINPAYKINLMCYNRLPIAFFGCLIWGVSGFVVFAVYVILVCLMTSMLLYAYVTIKNNINLKSDIELHLLSDINFSTKKMYVVDINWIYIIITGIASCFMIYVGTVGSGLLTIYITYRSQYNITTGLPVLTNSTNSTNSDTLFCHIHPYINMFVGCAPIGLLWWIVLYVFIMICCSVVIFLRECKYPSVKSLNC